ncbi:Serologically defined colon cancer antigen 8-like [Holothuria leucospilota]|uniref:Serologically defined colon cancer antigen 8-like n=1 Tax=Holothuria leucospilota TaxID=206669 RepID=A0A9Q1HFS8_HOLLE|nr:Serologically defined colon cancer antigen 8-like [Holothuria leucospilota]
MHPPRIPRHNAKGGRATSLQQSPRLSQSLPYTSPERLSTNRLSHSSSPRDFNMIRRRSRSMEHLLDEEVSLLHSPDSAALKLKTLLMKHERNKSDPLPLSEPSELRSKVSNIPRSVGKTDSYITGEPPDNLPRSEDLIPFLNSQGAYIQQLEGENKFYKEELLSLRSKTGGLVRENEKLQEELKKVIIEGLIKEEKGYQQAISLQDQETQINTEKSQQGVAETDGGKTFFIAWSKEHEKLKSLYESRVSLLESQISYARSELVNYEKLCEELKQKLRMQASYNLMSRLDGDIEQGLCGQCAKEKAILVPEGDTQKTAEELANVIRERDELVESLTGVRARVLEMQEREGDAYHQVQQGILLVEQAQLDRTEALIEKAQLKEDLARMEKSLNHHIVDNQMKLQRERDATRQECQQEIITLNEKILQLQNEMAATQVQLERETREKNNVKSELDETKSLLKEQEEEIDKFSDGAQYTAATAKVQRDTAFRQMERVRSSLEMELHVKEQIRYPLSAAIYYSVWLLPCKLSQLNV